MLAAGKEFYTSSAEENLKIKPTSAKVLKLRVQNKVINLGSNTFGNPISQKASSLIISVPRCFAYLCHQIKIGA